MKEEQAKATDLLEKIVELVREDLVGIVEKMERNEFIFVIPNGQKFVVSVMEK